MRFDECNYQSIDKQSLDRHITGNYGEDSLPHCDCPCLDCIEGIHCGEDDVIEGLGGESVRVECQYLVEPYDREDDY